jgi:hypothetical protein
VGEVGAEYGAFTRELLAWGDGRARVIAIDPLSQPELHAVAEQCPELELIEELSIDAFRSLPRLDAYVIDGDHNYYTVSEELRVIEQTAADGGFPLVVFHDVCWPHARRDSYYAPERIPEQDRQPLANDVLITPWAKPPDPDSGLRYTWVADHDGGPRNGVLTAIEDFIAERGELRFARVPAFFGFAALWPADAPWAAAVAALVEPLHDHPVLERLEGNRVVHLLERMRLEGRAHQLAKLEAEVRPILDSRAMAIAERLSSLRGRGGEPAVSRARLRDALPPR